MTKIPLVFFIISSAFTMNLVLQCALGVRGAVEAEKHDRISILTRLGIIFVTVILLWVIFFKIVSLIISGMFIYVLLFPIGYMMYDGFEYLLFRFLLKKDPKSECSISFPGGITAAAAFICINLANSFIEAAALSFGFISGIFIVFLILGEIKRRAALEAVPYFLRGKPLVLISMGMLSLVFSAASLLIFKMIGS